jgi:5'-nucleotidase
MKKRPFLLITNDDGIHSPGIKHLWEAVTDHAETAIIAPVTEKSGCGLSITWAKPLRVHPVAWEKNTSCWSVSGTPADCVKMGLNVFLDKPPQMILSGINRGSNAGKTVLYSGTVGGVIEGVLKGIPGIAFSFCDFDPPPLSVTKKYIFPLVQHLLEHPLPLGTFLNVNFPLGAKDGVKGFKLASQGNSYWAESPEKRLHPEGIPYYWLGGKWKEAQEDTTSDVALLDEGYITAVPIQIAQLTDHAVFQSRKDLIEKVFEGTNLDSLLNP